MTNQAHVTLLAYMICNLQTQHHFQKPLRGHTDVGQATVMSLVTMLMWGPSTTITMEEGGMDIMVTTATTEKVGGMGTEMATKMV